MIPSLEEVPDSANELCTCCRSDGWGCECLYHYESDRPFRSDNENEEVKDQE